MDRIYLMVSQQKIKIQLKFNKEFSKKIWMNKWMDGWMNEWMNSILAYLAYKLFGKYDVGPNWSLRVQVLQIRR